MLKESNYKKQGMIAEECDITIDMVRKLSQVSRFYLLANTEQELEKMKSLQFKVIELKYLEYLNLLPVLLNKMTDKTSRKEVQRWCQSANRLLDWKGKEMEQAYKSMVQTEIRIGFIQEKLPALQEESSAYKTAYNDLKKALSELDPDKASVVYNEYLTIKHGSLSGNGKCSCYVVLKTRLEYSHWSYLKKNNVIQYVKDSQLYETEVLNLRRFTEYMYKKTEVPKQKQKMQLNADCKRKLEEYEEMISSKEQELEKCQANLLRYKESLINRIEKVPNPYYRPRTKKIKMIPLVLDRKNTVLNDLQIGGKKIEEVQISPAGEIKLYRVGSFHELEYPCDKEQVQYDVMRYLSRKHILLSNE